MFLKYIRREKQTADGVLVRKYYRLTESYRDKTGKTRQHMILALGYMDELPEEEQRYQFLDCLNDLVLRGAQRLCPDKDVERYTYKVYQELRSRGLIDSVITNHHDVEKAIRAKEEEYRRCGYVTMDEFFEQKLTQSRPVGAENVCLSILRKLELERCLLDHGFTKQQARLAIIQIAARAIFPCSEYRTAKYLMKESSLCEMQGFEEPITKDMLYGSAKRLYDIRRDIENFLHDKVVSMFDIKEKIYLLDLSNSYFEGRYTNSKMLKHGRSKEKRTDCKQIVFGAVVNTDGLLVRTEIFDGNASDYKCMQPMINELQDDVDKKNLIIVMDAGMSGKENIKWLKDNGYQFITVMRGDHEYTSLSEKEVVVLDEKKQDIKLRLVSLAKVPATTKDGEPTVDYTGDTFLLVDSHAKAMKEQSMADREEALYVDGLNAIKEGLAKKGGTKKRDKVNERLGRLNARTGTAHLYYDVKLEYNGDTTTGITWNRKDVKAVEKQKFHGKYILRTNIKEQDEKTIWDFYNVIRNVETVFRVLKTDLDIRPVYHKTDNGIVAHLHLAILAYWVVSTAKYMLRKGGIYREWRSLMPTLNNQVVITSAAKMQNGKYSGVRKCSEPEPELCHIYDVLKVGHIPIKPRKFVWTQKPDFEKSDP